MSRVFCDIVKRNNVRSFVNISHGRYLSNSTDSKEYDVVIVGGGIVGAATAREMKGRHPQLKMAIVEKEDDLAQHQSGRNSGVVHAGIYYKPGSLKAKLCVEGLNLAYKYCDSKGIPYKKVGKLIVATNPMEVQRLYDLHSRAVQNNVPDIKLIKGLKAIQEIEPYCVGVEALWSPHTGIVDWQWVAKRYAQDFQESGGDIFLKYEVTDFKPAESADHPVLVVSKSNRKLKTKYVLTCGGLHSDHLAKLSGCPQTPKVVPFRGEYLLLNPNKAHLVRGNIYPVPDPRFPFLGVHFTPRMDGSVWLGPNAVLAFRREGYKWSDINISELLDAVSYQGLIRMGLRYTMAGAYEIAKSLYTPLQVRELHKFIPQITIDDVQPGPAGVRAQAVDPSGELVDDFYFDMNKGKTGGSIGDRVLHCRNAPSPGATSSLAIARMMADKLEDVFDLKNAL